MELRVSAKSTYKIEGTLDGEEVKELINALNMLDKQLPEGLNHSGGMLLRALRGAAVHNWNGREVFVHEGRLEGVDE